MKVEGEVAHTHTHTHTCRSKERLRSASSGKFLAKVASTGERKFLTVRGHVAPARANEICEREVSR